MATSVKVTAIKLCDICSFEEKRPEPLVAFFDVRTINGRWGNLYGLHMDSHSMHSENDLGTGKGQRLVYPEGLVQHYLDTGETSVKS